MDHFSLQGYTRNTLGVLAAIRKSSSLRHCTPGLSFLEKAPIGGVLMVLCERERAA